MNNKATMTVIIDGKEELREVAYLETFVGWLGRWPFPVLQDGEEAVRAMDGKCYIYKRGLEADENSEWEDTFGPHYEAE